MLVHGKTEDGRLVDLSRAARFQSLAARVFTVSTTGLVRPVADGAGKLEIEAGGKTVTLPVAVTGAARPRRFNFENDIVPILSRHGCNSSGCHGKAEGKNGFKLSVFGFDALADHQALTMEARGRRIFPGAPENSLMLRKAADHRVTEVSLRRL